MYWLSYWHVFTFILSLSFLFDGHHGISLCCSLFHIPRVYAHTKKSSIQQRTDTLYALDGYACASVYERPNIRKPKRTTNSTRYQCKRTHRWMDACALYSSTMKFAWFFLRQFSSNLFGVVTIQLSSYGLVLGAVLCRLCSINTTLYMIWLFITWSVLDSVVLPICVGHFKC